MSFTSSHTEIVSIVLSPAEKVSGDSAPIASSAPVSPPFKPDARFWLVFLALCVSCFLSALDLTSVSTTLPSIAADLPGIDAAWVGSAYALSSTALIPWTGGLAKIFGRRVTMLGSLVFFAVGSAVSGSAPSMQALIAGRTLQGVGGGGILVMTEIIVVDLIPLAARGSFFGVIGAVWAISSAIGPPIGGALANGGQWRWLFYMNLPISAIAMVLVAVFLDVKTPQSTMKEKMGQMDWLNALFVGAATATILGITFAGGSYAWSSVQVLAPLIIGLVGMALFIYLERFVKNPTIPFEILTHPTTLIGFFTNFLHGLLSLAAIYFLPLYFQASKGDSALKSGINLFTLSFTIAPFAILTGVSTKILGKYKWQNVGGWVFLTLGFGLTSLLKYNSIMAAWVCYPMVTGVGLGILYSGTTFPVLAPLRPDQQPHAMAFHAFTRSFGQVFGIAIGSTILQNELTKKLPSEFLSIAGKVSQVIFTAPHIIPTLPEPLKTAVEAGFADSIHVVWQVMIGISGMGFLASLLMKNIALATETDENWGLNEKKARPEAASSA